MLAGGQTRERRRATRDAAVTAGTVDRGDQHQVVAAGEHLLDRLPRMAGQVDHDRLVATPTRREHLAHHEVLQAHRAIAGPGEHRDAVPTGQRVAQVPPAEATRWWS